MRYFPYITVCCLIIIGGIIAFNQAAQVSTHPDLIIIMSRSTCYGACPAYRLEIYGNGEVVYRGELFVAVIGVRTARISQQQVERLVAMLERASFFSLKDNYPLSRDLPRTVISVMFGGQSKSIFHVSDSCGFGQHPPEALCELESKIDETTNSVQWIGKQAFPP